MASSYFICCTNLETKLSEHFKVPHSIYVYIKQLECQIYKLKNKIVMEKIMKTYSVEFTAYEVTESDGYTNSHVAYFKNYGDASGCAELQKGYRKVKTVTMSKSWTVYESFDEYDPKFKKQKREELIAKLTPEERELLGL